MATLLRDRPQAMSRITININDALLRRVMRIYGVTSKSAAVNIALRQAAERADVYDELWRLRGKLRWEGDLDAMRRDRVLHR